MCSTDSSAAVSQMQQLHCSATTYMTERRKYTDAFTRAPQFHQLHSSAVACTKERHICKDTFTPAPLTQQLHFQKYNRCTAAQQYV